MIRPSQNDISNSDTKSPWLGRNLKSFYGWKGHSVHKANSKSNYILTRVSKKPIVYMGMVSNNYIPNPLTEIVSSYF